MRRKQILELIKLEVEQNLPNNVLLKVKETPVEKDLSPIYDEVNASVLAKNNIKFTASLIGILFSLVLILTIVMPAINARMFPKINVVSKLGIEINPSIDLMLDNNNDVVLVIAKNKHAELLLSGENFVGKSANKVAEQIIELAVKAGYITTDFSEDVQNAVLINVASENEKTKNSLLQDVEDKIQKYFISHQIFGVVLTEFSSKDELVDLVTVLDYSLQNEERDDLMACSVTELNQILNNCYTQLKRRFRADFNIEEFKTHLHPICSEYAQQKDKLIYELEKVSDDFTNFETFWEDGLEMCQQKIDLWQIEIEHLQELLKVEIDEGVKAKIQAELDLKTTFILSEEREIADRVAGAEIFNASKERLLTLINDYEERLALMQKDFCEKLEGELVKIKQNLVQFNEQIKIKKQTILNLNMSNFENHLNNLINNDEFGDRYNIWKLNNNSSIYNLQYEWVTYKHMWQQNFNDYINF